MMIDVMIDMVTAKGGMIANDAGSMCGIGATAWTLGCPLDVMVKWESEQITSSDETGEAYSYHRPTALAFEGILRALKLKPYQCGIEASDLWGPHDEMHKYLDKVKNHLGYSDAACLRLACQEAEILIRNGHILGINFIIASSLPRGLWKTRKQQRVAAKQTVGV